MNVLVYTGEGASKTSLAHTFYSLYEVLGHHYAVVPVTDATLRSEPWEHNAALLVMPGGRDRPYVENLRGDKGNDRIRRYVRNGGRYLGLCAGGYYGCHRIEFEKDTPNAVCGPRELGFYPGVCKGTVYPGFSYNSEAGARAVEIRPAWDRLTDRSSLTPLNSTGSATSLDQQQQEQYRPRQFRVYYNGGGYFMHASQLVPAALGSPVVQVLATYAVDPQDHTDDWDGAAAVSCEVGRGRAVLTGIHPEYTPTKLNPRDYHSPDNADLVVCLEHDDGARQLFWKSLLAHLGLRVSARPMNLPALTPILLTASPWVWPEGSTPSSATEAALCNRQHPFDCLRREALAATALDTGDRDRIMHDQDAAFYVTDFSPTLFALLSPRDGPVSPSVVPDAKAENKGSSTSPQPSSSSSVPLDQILQRLSVEGGRTVASQARTLLPEDTFPLMLCPGLPPPPGQFTPRFDLRRAHLYLKELGARHMGQYLLYAETTTSTQTVLDANPRLSALLPSGLAFVATQQVRGRGRGKNPWISPAGCLQFSLVLRYPNLPPRDSVTGVSGTGAGPSPVLLQYLFGLAVVEAVRSCPGYEAIPLRLKWPNDVYAEVSSHTAAEPSTSTISDPNYDDANETRPQPRRLKVGGILVNSHFTHNQYTLVIGAGVNCQNSLPTTSVNELIREYNRQHKTQLAVWSEELLLARILAQFELFYFRFTTGYNRPANPLEAMLATTPTRGGSGDRMPILSLTERPLVNPRSLCQPPGPGPKGIAPFLPLYYERWLHTGQQVTLADHHHARVRINGITPDYGYLTTTAVDDAQTVYTLQPGGNSFDMMAGLIGKKSV
ncbi:biotin holocarboxylase synthetase [Tieghemiomyces parasiticus]|uniref:Biotin holocarboxylase synthetase n=1 Tax=Tieghemiomyces parasiticus TaxID=78921 RepID=A0A9W8A8D8_9FUNG|nr:biotin holocarboxylase synthetase [Tieghemiomyces parasiticus]